MKYLFALFVLFLFLGGCKKKNPVSSEDTTVWGENAVFNPSFDMSPWDSGWTIETDTSSKWDVTLVIAEVEPDSGKSLPNCCYIRTRSRVDAGGGGGIGRAKAKAMITQNFDGITGCMIRAHVKWYWQKVLPCPKTIRADIEGYINNEWKFIWRNTGTREETTWTEVCTTLADNDTLSGIRVCTESSFDCNCICGTQVVLSYLWVDDIYVGKGWIEESEKSQVTSRKLQVYPNPFVQWTDVRGQESDARSQDSGL